MSLNMQQTSLTDKFAVNSGHFWQCLPMLYSNISYFAALILKVQQHTLQCACHYNNICYWKPQRLSSGTNVWYKLQCPYKCQVLNSWGNVWHSYRKKSFIFLSSFLILVREDSKTTKEGFSIGRKKVYWGTKCWTASEESRNQAKKKQVGFIGFLKAYGHIPVFWEICPVLSRTGSTGCASWKGVCTCYNNVSLWVVHVFLSVENDHLGRKQRYCSYIVIKVPLSQGFWKILEIS